MLFASKPTKHMISLLYTRILNANFVCFGYNAISTAQRSPMAPFLCSTHNISTMLQCTKTFLFASNAIAAWTMRFTWHSARLLFFPRVQLQDEAPCTRMSIPTQYITYTTHFARVQVIRLERAKSSVCV